ncbi:MAG: T9SS type A sorting domain-containing protein [Candidatus Eisenbacteria bacterium]|nr:T9SS type A sorting domain-containing protein [Candidatus Eisenbacteria bacterium]
MQRSIRRTCQGLVLAGFGIACLAWGWTSPGQAQSVEAVTVIIDSQTTQPVGTGLIADSSADFLLFFAEGGHRTPYPIWTGGWWPPTGATHLWRVGQPNLEGMAFGTLIGDFGGSLGDAHYLGDRGQFEIQPAHVGDEFFVGLNMSDDDLANMEGQVVVHLLYLPDGTAESEVFELSPQSGQPVATGFTVADVGDLFVAFPYGAFRRLPADDYTHGWFGPDGYPNLFRAGMPLSRGPYGSVLGTYGSTLSVGFNIGDGGSWITSSVDLGDELLLGLNMSDSDLAGGTGQFKVNVIYVPGGVAALEPGAGHEATEGSRLQGNAPNPTENRTAIRFSLQREGHMRLRIYDAGGRVVRTLMDGVRAAGQHETAWDGHNDNGEQVPAGTYFYQLSTDSGSETKRLVILD